MIALEYVLIPLFTVVLFSLFRRRNPPREYSPPPSPAKLPIIGNLHQMSSLLHRSLKSLSEVHGKLMLLHFGSIPVLIVSSAEGACEIMKNQDLIFSNRPSVGLAQKLFYGAKDLGFAQYGEYWRQMKSIFVVHLLSNKKVQSFREIREEETSNLIEKIRASDSVVNLSEMIVGFTNDVICRVALGRKYRDDEEGRKFQKLLEELPQVLSSVDVGDCIPYLGWINKINGFDSRVEKLGRGLDEILSGILHERREKKKDRGGGGEEASNFIDIFLELQRENAVNISIEDEHIKAVILDMFTAGTDTTATALEWTMTELLRNPRAMKILQDEVRNTIKSEQITEDELPRMTYLKAVIKESLRFHPPLPLLVPRESTQATKVMGYDIPTRTRVMINNWAIASDSSIWEDPQEFKPERFLTGTGKNIDFRGLHFELIPFGAGRRGCPGISFAMGVVELIVAKLVYHFDFSLSNGETEHDLDVSEAPGISIRKKLPLLVVAN